MFPEIIGQERLKKYLKNEILHDTLSYGYIIEGNRFMGKKFIARQIAEAITAPAYIYTLMPSNNRKLIHVDDIRDMQESAYTQSYGGYRKVYILPNADEMTNQAQNAFLKILEEPPQDCVFFILAINRFTLLSTIRSRCNVVQLARYTDPEIKSYLMNRSIEYNAETLRLCDGTLNKYLYLSSKEFSAVDELAWKVLLNIKKLHKSRIFAIFKHVQKLKDYSDDLLDIFLLWYRDLYVYSVIGDESLLENPARIEDIKVHINDYTPEQLLKIIDEIEWCRIRLSYNCNLEMSINTLLLYMAGVME